MDKFDDGSYNCIIRGYLVIAMKYADFTVEEALRAIGGLWAAMDTFPAADAENVTVLDWDRL